MVSGEGGVCMEPNTTTPAAQAQSADGRTTPAAAPCEPAETRSLEEQIEALRAEVAELRDKHLRALAESRNVQQRAQRDRDEALRYAEAEFARELLVVLDDLERAQESARSGADPAALSEGIRISHEHFLKILRGRRIEPIEALGKPFDPNVHEALMRQPSADVAANVVMQEVARGYRMHDRVLRPTRVVVSDGPAAPSGGTTSADQGGEA
jgi:molecular chaperone GrpE